MRLRQPLRAVQHGEPDWIKLDAPILNTTNWAVGTGFTAYRKDPDTGLVTLRGNVHTTTGYSYGAGTATIATLPPGYRPLYSMSWPVISTTPAFAGIVPGDYIRRLSIDTNGNIKAIGTFVSGASQTDSGGDLVVATIDADTGATNTDWYLDGITYYTY